MSEQYHIRLMIRIDLPAVLAIEAECFEFPWSEDDFIRCVRQRNCIGLVIEHDERVIGYTIYELHKARLQVLNFAVSQWLHRCGAGRELLDRLKSKLWNRNRILLEIRESNLDAQKFFSSQGFRAISVLKGFYGDTDEDAYLFQFRKPIGSPVREHAEAQF